MSARLAIVVALEALETGDTAYAVDVLLTALEDGAPEESLAEPDRASLSRALAVCTSSGSAGETCPACRLRLRWPGELRDHLRVVHDLEEAA